jgi:hypothetical protein
MDLTVDMFREEIADAVKNYDRFVVCLDKTPDEFEEALRRLMKKAIDVYVNRAPNLRHGIALYRQVTIIISQTDGETPLCAIYFNLHSPYQKKAAAKPAGKE